jgi:hypothetical protein
MLRKLLPAVMMLPIFFAGESLASALFEGRQLPYYLILILWPSLSLFVMFKFCFKGESVVVHRMMNLLFFQILVLVVGIWL